MFSIFTFKFNNLYVRNYISDSDKFFECIPNLRKLIFGLVNLGNQIPEINLKMSFLKIKIFSKTFDIYF